MQTVCELFKKGKSFWRNTRVRGFKWPAKGRKNPEKSEMKKIANSLNQQLYSAVFSVPAPEVDRLWCLFSGILTKKYQAQQTHLDAWYPHRYRLYMTIQELSSLVSGLHVLEMGAVNPVTDLLRHYFPDSIWFNTVGDLRQPWSYPDNSMDLIISMEVLEHLQDLPDTDRFQELFKGSGVDIVLKESYRLLKPGAHLFITTPNGVSIWHLRNCLMGLEPRFANIHVREYTPNELISRIQAHGFTIEYWKTVHCMTTDHQIDYTPIFSLLIENGFDTDHRGDDIFLMARK